MTESDTQHAHLMIEEKIPSSPALHFGFAWRLGCLAALFAIELVSITGWMDTRAMWGPGRPVVRAVIAFAAFFLTFAYLRSKAGLQRIADRFVETPIKWGLLAAHVCAFAALVAVISLQITEFTPGSEIPWGILRAGKWLLAGLAIVFAGFGFVAPRVWLDLVRSTGSISLYAAGATGATLVLLSRSESLWQPATTLTFNLVRLALKPILPGLIADPSTATIGTHRFAVTILAPCSGVEGVALMLVFSTLWLWIFRRECRFPQALLLIPAGICILWSLNVVRIAVLVLIGNAGAPGIAVGGFHSQAGWIAFNLVALGFSLAAQRVPWFTHSPRQREVKAASTDNPTAAYLTPFLAILAAAMISRAASGTFEWLYALRFFAAAGALWFMWPKYAKLNWEFGWVAPVAGAAVFALWLGLDMVNGVHAVSQMPADLAAMPGAARNVWIAFRILAAVLTVPIAEELAFRGFLMRRFISADFESVDPRTFTVISIIVSSVAFGLLHGDRWIAGTIAGAVYGGAVLWRGRIGDAVVAHGVSNALIAVWVLAFGNWQLW